MDKSLTIHNNVVVLTSWWSRNVQRCFGRV